METLERVWEGVGDFFGGITGAFEKGLQSIFGSSNARFLKRLEGNVAAIEALESKYEPLSDEELKHQTTLFRQRLAQGETLDDLLIEAFAVCREGGKRFLGMRHYNVQLLGGMVLHSGNIAEMVTGEGKTLVATLPAYLNALEGKGVHVVTVNDYLARRDMEWMGPLYMGLGLTVGNIQSGMGTLERQQSYACDITYGTNNEFGFDYLRDNMRMARRGDERFPKEMQQSQGFLNYAIIDEVDNILIDEARTPLIISGPAHDDVTRYPKADKVARQLKKGEHFEVKEKEHSCHMTEEGVRVAEKLAGVESFYTAGNTHWPHMIDNALKAHHLYKLDVNYVIKDAKIVIVDEFTGRLMEGRQWSDGLHQAVEAKEGVPIKEENQTLATITLQNFFKLYKKLSGMTGTALTEAGEFWKIYKLDVIAVPTNRGLQRINYPDAIYRSEREKYVAIAEEIERYHKWDVLETSKGEIWGHIVSENDNEVAIQPKGSKEKQTVPRKEIKQIEPAGRPILVGTTSIEKSERLSELLNRRGIKHEVLNAKHHQREAEIIAQAGRKGAVTIATNMAGRGTDIILGGNPEALAWAQLQDKYETRLDVPQSEWDQLVGEFEQREHMKEEGRAVAKMGGLCVMGTERHEARRIDLQLRGRCGRQGDPGSSRFYLSLEDDLMRIFAGEWVKGVLTRLGMQEGEAIESKMVTRRVEGAQKKVEERNFEIRKNLLEYDEVMDEQRKRVYSYRQRILDGANCKALIQELIDKQVNEAVNRLLHKDYGVEACAAQMEQLFGCEFDPRDFRDMDITSAERFAHDEADRWAEQQVFDDIEENLPTEEEESEWNWDALAKVSNRRWKLSLRDKDLKKLGRDDCSEFLIEKAKQSLREVDVRECERYLAEDYGLREVCTWAKAQFNVDVALEEIRELEAESIKEFLRQRTRQAYDLKEVEYPVLTGMYRYSESPTGQPKMDREQLVAWARERFDAELDLEDLKSKQGDEIFTELCQHSRAFRERAERLLAEGHEKIEQVVDSDGRVHSGANGKLDSLTAWFEQNMGEKLSSDELQDVSQEELEERLVNAYDDRYRPELRWMERQLLLQILDEGWKEHLLTMDHLRSGISMVSYAQKDPKVEYKREGMKLFEQMWTSFGGRVTELAFRMERLDRKFVRSTFKETVARHDEAGSATEQLASQSEQQQGIDASNQPARTEPIRNRGERVGRNAPCPCGSGKKYKQCCGRAGAAPLKV